MSLYVTGTITGALNATTITGTGTKWSDAKIGITNGSVLFVSSNAGVDGVYQVKRVISDTSIELAQPIFKAFNASQYSIMVAESASTAAWSNQLAATLGYYQAQMDGWQQIMTGTGDIALTAPDGTKVTIKSFTKMSQDIDKKQDKSDILTDLSKSKDADGVREYLGLNESLKSKVDVYSSPRFHWGVEVSNADSVSDSGKRVVYLGSNSAANNASNGCAYIVNRVANKALQLMDNGTINFDNKDLVLQDSVAKLRGVEVGTGGPAVAYPNVILQTSSKSDADVGKNIFLESALGGNFNIIFRSKITSENQVTFSLFAGNLPSKGSYILLGTHNTTSDTNGFIKKASPIMRLFNNEIYDDVAYYSIPDGFTPAGSGVVNIEAQGVTASRVDIGIYKVSGANGFALEGWQIETPFDDNGLPLLWIDKYVQDDGSIIVRTYHREHVAAPVFANNKIQGITDGQPIDIPHGRWIDLRLSVPSLAEHD
ncbi:hypothetical protein [Hafnia alvei]|uniref:phage tail fiber protein n=1 Tax=Hafnia alvei TaxID=569 RepID=UPI0024A88E8E|nr:hypothetical protein [Hafnia alvei]